MAQVIPSNVMPIDTASRLRIDCSNRVIGLENSSDPIVGDGERPRKCDLIRGAERSMPPELGRADVALREPRSESPNRRPYMLEPEGASVEPQRLAPQFLGLARGRVSIVEWVPARLGFRSSRNLSGPPHYHR